MKRQTTPAQLDRTLARVLETVKSRVEPGYTRLFQCGGGCEDTGWVEVAPHRVRRCDQCGGQYSKPSHVSRGRVGQDFS